MVSSYVEILKRYSASLATWLVHMLKFSEVFSKFGNMVSSYVEVLRGISKFGNMFSSYVEILGSIQQV